MKFIPKKQNQQTIGQVMQQWLREHANSVRATESRLKLAWADLLGPAVNSRTTSIHFGRDGKLRVKLSSAPLRNELMYSRSQILDELNRTLGEPLVKELDLI